MEKISFSKMTDEAARRGKAAANSPHRLFFQRFFSRGFLAKGIFELSFDKKKLRFFDWDGLMLEKDDFVKGRRADLFYSVPVAGYPGEYLYMAVFFENQERYDWRFYRDALIYQTEIIERDLENEESIRPLLVFIFYQGRQLWRWPLSFQEGTMSREQFEQTPESLRKSMINFRFSLADVNSSKAAKAIGSPGFQSRAGLYLLRSAARREKPDSRFAARAISMLKGLEGDNDELIWSAACYMEEGLGMSRETWLKAEAEAVKKGVLKKGGYLDLKNIKNIKGFSRGGKGKA